jgi:hypothetical protein
MIKGARIYQESFLDQVDYHLRVFVESRADHLHRARPRPTAGDAGPAANHQGDAPGPPWSPNGDGWTAS